MGHGTWDVIIELHVGTKKHKTYHAAAEKLSDDDDDDEWEEGSKSETKKRNCVADVSCVVTRRGKMRVGQLV